MVEAAAMQMDKGHDRDGDKIATAFVASGFKVGRGPEGETVLSMTVGDTGKISFAYRRHDGGASDRVNANGDEALSDRMPRWRNGSSLHSNVQNRRHHQVL